jgi:hypothetical protein
MPVTVRGTDILFNDATTQNTAGQPTSTALVLAAYAGTTAGVVGAVAQRAQTFTTWTANSTVAGSVFGLSGTWRALQASVLTGTQPCACVGLIYYYGGAYVRIS